MSVEIKGEVTRLPEMRFTPTGRKVLTLRVDDRHVIAWEEKADRLAWLKLYDVIELRCSVKPYTWKGHDGEEHSRDEYTVQGIIGQVPEH